MALQKQFVQGWTDAFIDVILANVLHAVAGIPLFGTKPFAGLQAWSDALIEQASQAFSKAQDAQSSADQAQVKSSKAADGVQTITDGISAAVGNAATGNDPSTVRPNVESISESATSVGTQVNSIVQALSQPGYPMWWSGNDPGAEVTFPFYRISAHDHSYFVSGSTGSGGDPSHAHSVQIIDRTRLSDYASPVTVSTGRWGLMRIQTSSQKKSVSFFAQAGSGSLNGLYIDVYQLQNDGSATLIASSGDLKDQVTSSTMQVVIATFDAGISAVSGQIFGFQIRVAGAATVQVPSTTLALGPNTFRASNTRPFGFGVVRNTSSSAAPQSISQTVMDSSYDPTVPYISLGAATISQILYFYDDFNSRNQLGSAYYSLGTSGGPAVSSGSLVYNGSSDGTQAAIYYQPSHTSKIAMGFTCLANANRLASGGGLGCDASGNGGAWLSITSSQVTLSSGSYKSQSSVASWSSPSNTVGKWGLFYDPDTKNYSITFNGNTFATWTDTGNAISRPSSSYAGLFLTRNFFTNSSDLDNFSFFDN